LVTLFEMENIESFTPNPREKQFTDQTVPNNPHWHPVVAVLVWLASVGFIFVFQSVLVFSFLINREMNASGVNVAEAVENLRSMDLPTMLKKDPTLILIAISSVIIAHLFTILLAWMVVTKFGKVSFTEALGWKWNGFRVWMCFVIVALFYFYAAGMSWLFGSQDNELKQILESSRNAVYIIAFMATFSAPLVEEVIYRGILYSAFRKSLGVTFAVTLTTALFAAVHVPQYYPDLATILTICVLSLVLTLLREKTGNLLPCIVLHTIFNGSQSILLLLQPYLESLIPATTEEKPAMIMMTIYRIIYGSI
jgi:uncharacterized protein